MSVGFPLKAGHFCGILIWKFNKILDVLIYLETIDRKTKFVFQFYRDLNRKCNQVKNCKAKIELLGSYDPQRQLTIEDPYYVSTAVPSKRDSGCPGAGCEEGAPGRLLMQVCVSLSRPSRAATPTLRWCTSSVRGAAEPSWRRPSRRPHSCASGPASECSDFCGSGSQLFLQ